MEAPSLDALVKTHQTQGKHGHLAGSVLLPLYLMEKTGIPNASLNKVFTLLKNFATSEKAIYADDTKMATSENWHRQQWEQFKPVAHFWAALELNKENSRYAYAEPGTAFKTSEGFVPFLEVAAGILEFGCSFIPKRAYPKVPVLDYSRAWTLPQEIPRRDVAKGMPPDKRILEWLGVYKKKSESKR